VGNGIVEIGKIKHMEADEKKPPHKAPQYDPCPYCGGRVDEQRNENGELVTVFCTKCDDYFIDYK